MPTNLSPVAQAILDGAPDQFRSGAIMSVRRLEDFVPYSSRHIHRGLVELSHTGLVVWYPYGRRRQYAGNF